MGNFFKIDLEGVGHGFDLSVAAVGGTFSAVVKLHLVVEIISRG